jgi:uncharacterized membrane protein YgaE (UPF0421/DUF939 family)
VTEPGAPASALGEELARRGEELLEEARRRSGTTLRGRLDALRQLALPVLQSAVAAAGAWLVARKVVGHAQPFFAPMAAIIVVGATFARRARRAIELVLGVTLGIAVADLLIAGIGTGTAQIALVVVLAMTAAILLGGGPILVSQAAVSAVLVATLQPPTHGISFARAIDALVGGAAAFAVTVLVPVRPVAMARRAVAPLTAELAATLEDIAGALAARDMDAAERAVARARDIDARSSRFGEVLHVAAETARLAPPGTEVRTRFALYEGAATQLDLAVRNVRVLARGAVRALLLDEAVPPQLGEALRDLARAVRGLDTALERGEGAEEARAAAIRAAGRATLVLEQTGNLSVSVLVGQVRSTAVDLLRALGLDRDAGREAVRDAARTLEEGQ